MRNRMQSTINLEVPIAFNDPNFDIVHLQDHLKLMPLKVQKVMGIQTKIVPCP